jgi:hypothetical protein
VVTCCYCYHCHCYTNSRLLVAKVVSSTYQKCSGQDKCETRTYQIQSYTRQKKNTHTNKKKLTHVTTPFTFAECSDSDPVGSQPVGSHGGLAAALLRSTSSPPFAALLSSLQPLASPAAPRDPRTPESGKKKSLVYAFVAEMTHAAIGNSRGLVAPHAYSIPVVRDTCTYSITRAHYSAERESDHVDAPDGT